MESKEEEKLKGKKTADKAKADAFIQIVRLLEPLDHVTRCCIIQAVKELFDMC